MALLEDMQAIIDANIANGSILAGSITGVDEPTQTGEAKIQKLNTTTQDVDEFFGFFYRDETDTLVYRKFNKLNY